MTLTFRVGVNAVRNGIACQNAHRRATPSSPPSSQNTRSSNWREYVLNTRNIKAFPLKHWLYDELPSMCQVLPMVLYKKRDFLSSVLRNEVAFKGISMSACSPGVMKMRESDVPWNFDFAGVKNNFALHVQRSLLVQKGICRKKPISFTGKRFFISQRKFHNFGKFLLTTPGKIAHVIFKM